MLYYITNPISVLPILFPQLLRCSGNIPTILAADLVNKNKLAKKSCPYFFRLALLDSVPAGFTGRIRELMLVASLTNRTISLFL